MGSLSLLSLILWDAFAPVFLYKKDVSAIKEKTGFWEKENLWYNIKAKGKKKEVETKEWATQKET